MRAIIKLNKFTANHGTLLKKWGFEVTVDEKAKLIRVDGIVGFVDTLSLDPDKTKAIATLKEMVGAKKLLTYASTVNGKRGTPFKGSMSILEGIAKGLSALVVQPEDRYLSAIKAKEEKAAKKAQGPSDPFDLGDDDLLL